LFFRKKQEKLLYHEQGINSAIHTKSMCVPKF
jgi:hypothetical protein